MAETGVHICWPEVLDAVSKVGRYGVEILGERASELCLLCALESKSFVPSERLILRTTSQRLSSPSSAVPLLQGSGRKSSPPAMPKRLVSKQLLEIHYRSSLKGLEKLTVDGRPKWSKLSRNERIYYEACYAGLGDC